ncbi:ABC transporter ATP-binding protein [Gemmatimonadota bacterium]
MSPAWRYYLSLHRNVVKTLLLVVFGSLLLAGIPGAIAVLVRRIIDEAIPAGDARTLILLGILSALLHLAGTGVGLLIRQASLNFSHGAVMRLRESLVEKLNLLPRSYTTRTDLKQLHTRIVEDTQRLTFMTNVLVPDLVPSVIASLALCGVLCLISWRLSGALLVVVPLIALTSRALGGKVRRQVLGYRRAFDVFSRGILFLLERRELSRIQSAESWERERQMENIRELRRISDEGWIKMAFGSVLSSLFAAGVALVLIVGGLSYANGTMSMGDILSFVVVLTFLTKFLRVLWQSFPRVTEGQEALRALYQLMTVDEPPVYSGTRQIQFGGEVVLDRISFRYDGEPLLEEVDLHLSPGATVALVGPNGSGKTTMVNLILGFYRPRSGLLLADGVPFDELDLAELRRSIGVVPQTPTVFSGTLRENICFGTQGVGPAEIEEAGRLADLDSFVQALPEGYDTPAGEGGTLISGGQTQRVAIARALVRRPRLLILDEPGNHLDSESLSRILGRICSLPYRPSILLISHQDDVVRFASEVFELQGGRLRSKQGMIDPPGGG